MASPATASPRQPAGPSGAAGQRARGLVLAVLALTGLMLVLDITITNVALPTIQRALHTTTQDLQQILGFSAIQAGLGSLPLALAVIAAAQLATRLIGPIGAKRLAAGGLVLSAAALLLLGRIHPDGSYAADVLGPVLLQGLGMGLVFMPVMVSAMAGVPTRDQGLVSGILQTTQQVGVALGMAALTTVATATTQGLLARPSRPAMEAALTGGYAAGIRGAALLALAGAAAAVLLLPASSPIRPAETTSPSRRAAA